MASRKAEKNRSSMMSFQANGSWVCASSLPRLPGTAPQGGGNSAQSKPERPDQRGISEQPPRTGCHSPSSSPRATLRRYARDPGSPPTPARLGRQTDASGTRHPPAVAVLGTRRFYFQASSCKETELWVHSSHPSSRKNFTSDSKQEFTPRRNYPSPPQPVRSPLHPPNGTYSRRLPAPGKGAGSGVRDPLAGWRARRRASCHLVVPHAEVSVQRLRSRGGPGPRGGAALRRRLRAAGRRRLLRLLLLLLRGPLLLAAEAAVHEQQAGAHGGER